MREPSDFWHVGWLLRLARNLAFISATLPSRSQAICKISVTFIGYQKPEPALWAWDRFCKPA